MSLRAWKIGVLLLTGCWLWAAGVGEARAQGAPPPPPPPAPPPTQVAPPAPPDLRTLPQPVPVKIVGRGPAHRAKPAPRHRRRRRRGSSPYGRFYVGAGAGYLWPGNELGEQFESGGAYALWTGWRKGWLGFELGYLGAFLTSKWATVPLAANPETAGNTAVWDPYTGDAQLHQFTADAKLFWTIFCRSSLYARAGLNYTILDYGSGFANDGFGWQAGAGWDFRIRLSWAPDLILKLRAEGLYTWARLRCGDGTGCKDFSGTAAMVYVNLGWSPW